VNGQGPRELDETNGIVSFENLGETWIEGVDDHDRRRIGRRASRRLRIRTRTTGEKRNR
jgi:hypothetical protein